MKASEHLTCSLFFFQVALAFNCLSQVPSKQEWNDFVVNYSFANAFNLENTLSYNTKLNAPRWYELAYNPVLRWSPSSRFDIITGVTLSYVQQNDTANTFELRPSLGLNYYITPNNRLLTFLSGSVEERNFQNLEDKSWETSSRFRTRAAAIFPINRSSHYDDKQLYVMSDIEGFWIVDKDVNERFANRLRVRAGLGYRYDYRWRFEVIYLQQRAKNNIGEQFYTSDNILWIKIRHFIARAKKIEP